VIRVLLRRHWQGSVGRVSEVSMVGDGGEPHAFLLGRGGSAIGYTNKPGSLNITSTWMRLGVQVCYDGQIDTLFGIIHSVRNVFIGTMQT